MNRVTIGSGDGLSLSRGTLLGNMEGCPYRDSEGKGIVRVGFLPRGPIGEPGEKVHLQGTLSDSD
jgi:hypothetical protein